jgi:hypothetical protein
MKKGILVACSPLFALTATAVNAPWFGQKGSVSCCFVENFVCKNGSFSE